MTENVVFHKCCRRWRNVVLAVERMGGPAAGSRRFTVARPPPLMSLESGWRHPLHNAEIGTARRRP